jgi:hypothetical protein
MVRHDIISVERSTLADKFNGWQQMPLLFPC